MAGNLIMDADNNKPTAVADTNDPTSWEPLPSNRAARPQVHKGVALGESAISDMPIIDNGFEAPKISSQEEIEVSPAELQARINPHLVAAKPAAEPVVTTPSQPVAGPIPEAKPFATQEIPTPPIEEEAEPETELSPVAPVAAIPVPEDSWSPTVEPPEKTLETKTPEPMAKAPATATTVVTPAPVKAPETTPVSSTVQAPKVVVAPTTIKEEVKRFNWRRLGVIVLSLILLGIVIAVGRYFWQTHRDRVVETPTAAPDEAVSAVCPLAVDPVMQANLLLESQRFEAQFKPTEITDEYQQQFTDFVHHLQVADTEFCANFEECVNIFGSEMELPLLWVEQDLTDEAKDGRLEVGVVVNSLYQNFGIERINWAMYPRFSYNEDDNTIQLIPERSEPKAFPFELTWVLVKNDGGEMVLIADSQTNDGCQYRGCPCEPARYYLVLSKINGRWVYRKQFVRLLTEGEITKLAYKFGGQ